MLEDARNLLPGSLELLARQVVEGFITGLHKSPFHGFSVEFSEHRLYNTGESVRNIDWKLYSRTDKLFVKRYEEETNLRCQLVVDVSSSMYFPDTGLSKIGFAATGAAAIMAMLKRQRDAVGLTLFANTVRTQTDARSSTTHHKILLNHLEEALHEKPVQRTTSAIQALHEVAERIHKRSLVVIFSDMADSAADPEALYSALQHLRYNKHEVVLFLVSDGKRETDFDYDNRPYLFEDSETGERIKLNPVQIRDSYLAQLQAFRQELTLRAGQYKIDLVEADIREGYRQILLPYLLKRQRML